MTTYDAPQAVEQRPDDAVLTRRAPERCFGTQSRYVLHRWDLWLSPISHRMVERRYPKPGILVRSFADGDGVTVEIGGTGSGIAPAIRVRIFDP